MAKVSSVYRIHYIFHAGVTKSTGSRMITNVTCLSEKFCKHDVHSFLVVWEARVSSLCYTPPSINQQLLQELVMGQLFIELVQLNESFQWMNWTNSQFWNELVHSFSWWTTLGWTRGLRRTDERLLWCSSSSWTLIFSIHGRNWRIFSILLFFLVLFSKKYTNFSLQLGFRWIK